MKMRFVSASIALTLVASCGKHEQKDAQLKSEEQGVALDAALPGTGRIPAGMMYGVTIDNIAKLSRTVESVSTLAKKVVVRVVFDETETAASYKPATTAIYQKAYVMGEILDSYYVKTFTVEKSKQRVASYLDTLFSTVDIWEVGNEVNGEWLGTTPDVVAKISAAYDMVKAKGGVTELTLYYNKDCWEKPANEMFKWTNANVPARMKQGLDYVLVSYYEDDCNGLRPNWQDVFNQLGAIFPNSRIGIGEMGTRKNLAAKKDHLNRYYNMKINHPRFIGGHFYWYYFQDMVPKTKELWSYFNGILMKLP